MFKKIFYAVLCSSLVCSCEVRAMHVNTHSTYEVFKKTAHALFIGSTVFASNFIVRKNRFNLNFVSVIGTAYLNHCMYKEQPKSIWILYGAGLVGGMATRKIVDKGLQFTTWFLTEL